MRKKVSLINISNFLTLSRIFLSPLFLFLPYDSFRIRLGCFILLLYSEITDALDGFLARKMENITTAGKLLDPLADKILHFTIFIIFIQINEFSIVPLFILLIIYRDLIIETLRIYSSSKGIVIPSRFSGKVKTTSQAIVLVFLLLCLLFNYTYILPLKIIGNISFFIMTTISLISGVDYILAYKHIFKEN